MTQAAVPAQFPQAFYQAARAAGEPVLAIDASRSWVKVRVYSGGVLRSLGHDHVISAAAIHGYALDEAPLSKARADLYLALDALQVDDPEQVADAGLAVPSRADAAATRRNMLDKVTEAARYPFLLVHAECADAPCSTLEAGIALHGTVRQFRIPVTLRHGRAGALTADGRFHVRHSDFGLTPYQILNGALRVEDGMDVEFHLRAGAV